MPKVAELPASISNPPRYHAALPGTSLELQPTLTPRPSQEVREGPQSELKETLVWPTAQRKQRLLPRKKK